MNTATNFQLQRSRKGFTLVELLVVMAIIATLAGISTPLIMGKLDKAKETKSKALATQLELAIDSFHKDYHKLPTPEVQYPLEDNIRSPYIADATDPYGPAMLRILANQELDEDKINYKGVQYFSPSEGKAAAIGAIGGASVNTTGAITGLYDEYGQPYHIVLNFDHDSGTEAPGIKPLDAVIPPIIKLTGKDAAVFSAGKDRKVLTRDDIKAW